LIVSIVVAIAVIPLAGFSFYVFETPARRLISGAGITLRRKAASRGHTSDDVAIESVAGLDR
jgi:peptidoglycan/LPS O-acetylase OafA/YrhL